MKVICEKIRDLSTNVCFFLKNGKVIHIYPQWKICKKGLSHVFKMDENLHPRIFKDGVFLRV